MLTNKKVLKCLKLTTCSSWVCVDFLQIHNCNYKDLNFFKETEVVNFIVNYINIVSYKLLLYTQICIFRIMCPQYIIIKMVVKVW